MYQCLEQTNPVELKTLFIPTELDSEHGQNGSVEGHLQKKGHLDLMIMTDQYKKCPHTLPVIV